MLLRYIWLLECLNLAFVFVSLSNPSQPVQHAEKRWCLGSYEDKLYGTNVLYYYFIM